MVYAICHYWVIDHSAVSIYILILLHNTTLTHRLGNPVTNLAGNVVRGSSEIRIETTEHSGITPVSMATNGL